MFVLVIPKILSVVVDVKAVVGHFHVGNFFSPAQFFGYFIFVATNKVFIIFEILEKRTVVTFRAFFDSFRKYAVCYFSYLSALFGCLFVPRNKRFDILPVKRYFYPLH